MRGMWLLGLLASVEAAAAPVRCDVDTKHRCTPDGCAPVAATTYAIVDGSARTYARCDDRGCDTHPATFAVSGEFLNVALPERGPIRRGASARCTAEHQVRFAWSSSHTLLVRMRRANREY